MEESQFFSKYVNHYAMVLTLESRWNPAGSMSFNCNRLHKGWFSLSCRNDASFWSLFLESFRPSSPTLWDLTKMAASLWNCSPWCPSNC